MKFALIPAGGHSQRMGRPKLALPLGDRTILEHVVAALREAAIDQILVVVGSHVPELRWLAEKAAAEVLLLTEATADMRATVEHGLRWLADRRQPQERDAWLLVPADHPTIRADVVRQLVRAYEANPDATIVVPTFQGRRGHPVLFAWRHAHGIRALAEGQGVNAYVRQHAAAVREVAVDCADILWDLDTPEDYERLRSSWRANPFPGAS